MKTKILVFIMLIFGLVIGRGCDNPSEPKNKPPVIESVIANPAKVKVYGFSQLVCTAYDPDGDGLTYIWEALSGSLMGSGDSITWIALNLIGTYWVSCNVLDGNGGQDIDSVSIEVVQSLPAEGLMVYYPFTGNADDSSGHSMHGSVLGPVLTQDKNGKENRAYLFDGIDDYIRIENKSILNLTSSITISVWAKGAAFGPDGGESFCGLVSKGPIMPYGLGLDDGDRVLFRIISSGNWYEALKTGIVIDPALWYHYAGVFEAGNSVRLYLNGNEIVNNASSIPQSIDASDYDLWIGTRAHSQSPYSPGFYFKGAIDEVRIYNRALDDHEIKLLYKLYD